MDLVYNLDSLCSLPISSVLSVRTILDFPVTSVKLMQLVPLLMSAREYRVESSERGRKR